MEIGKLTTTLQGYTKYIKYVIFAILLTVIAVTTIQKNNLKDEVQLKSVQLLAMNDTAKIYKTKAGDYYSKLGAVGIGKDNLKKSLDILGFTNKELRDRNIKQSNIISALQMKLIAADSIHSTVRDSIIYVAGQPNVLVQKLNWTNNYLTLSGIIKDKQFDGAYDYRIFLKAITEKKGKSYIVTTYVTDPKATITQGSQVIVTPTKTTGEKIMTWVWRAVAFGTGYLIKQ
jgi:hypothetical protein